jgi:hypothetical protein
MKRDRIKLNVSRTAAPAGARPERLFDKAVLGFDQR